MWNVQQTNKKEEMSKQNTNNHIDMDNRMEVSREAGLSVWRVK